MFISSPHQLFTLSSTMADESVYYVFSKRVPCLRESKDQMCRFSLSDELTCPSTELSQQDRLIDSQTYLKVLNRKEIQIVVQHAHLCSCTMLLLASLLRVSVYSNLPRASACLTSPATSLSIPPLFPPRFRQYSSSVLHL